MSRSIVAPCARIASLTLAVTVLAGFAGCDHQTSEESKRAIAAKMQEKIAQSMVDYEAVALQQKVDPGVVLEVQRNLAAINEYQDEPTGKLDSVTINAIQAFQRTIDCSWLRRVLRRCVKDDGIIGEETRQQLAAAAGQAKK
jgi:peptidoglycan hydrolase-like protein with peptidoglycan-binding domain